MAEMAQRILDDHDAFRRHVTQLDELRDDPARPAKIGPSGQADT